MRELRSNSATCHYVWALDAQGAPRTTPSGPMTLRRAELVAQREAQDGGDDQAVSLGADPQACEFEVVRQYRRGSGERVL